MLGLQLTLGLRRGRLARTRYKVRVEETLHRNKLTPSGVASQGRDPPAGLDGPCVPTAGHRAQGGPQHESGAQKGSEGEVGGSTMPGYGHERPHDPLVQSASAATAAVYPSMLTVSADG